MKPVQTPLTKSVEFVFSHQLCFEKGPHFRFQKEANAEPYTALFG